MAVTQNSLIENTTIGCDLYIKSYVNGVPRFVLFCRGGEIFGNERKEELIRKNINKLFIPTRNLKNYFKYQENNLKSVITDKKKTSQEKSHVVYHVAKYLTQDLLSDPRSGSNIGRVANWVDNTVSYILHDLNAFSTLLKVTAHDYYTYTHSVNLAVLGLLFGKHIALNPHNLNSLGIGMLLHDVGKIEIPLEILNKPGKLTEEEFELAKKHVEIGIRILEEKENIAEESRIIVSQHHENHNGTGYPNRIGGNDIHLFGNISRIIDVYDAITTNRPYRIAKKPFKALVEMKEKMPNCFDQELFKEFIYFLGPKKVQETQEASVFSNSNEAELRSSARKTWSSG